MPELPEVEIGARNLRRWMRGAKIIKATIADTRIVRGATARSIERALRGRTVRKVHRRGKWVRLTLDDGRLLFSHFGMSGKWVMRPVGEPSERAQRARLDVRKGTKTRSVRYLDPRMFGRLLLAREDIGEWSALGPDPLVDGIDSPRLYRVLHAANRTIKEALLDQTILAGIGNIQATEALWFAGVDPRARTNALTTREVRALALGIERSIAATLAHESGPEITYVEEAGAPNPFKIYGRGGKPCPRCKTPLHRVMLGGRGTVFCEKCQPAKGT
ncbi:MAG: bifunctional DNA-formamidopyrimidine glycosylase/DNA-(apurinic or apyrimidinic site) lyase [Polyangiales bacterium]